MIDYFAMGKRIRCYRERMNWRQCDLAEAVNMSATTISHIEVGKGRPQLETVVNIANALHVTLDMLLCDSINKAEAVYSNDISEMTNHCSHGELRLLNDIIPTILESFRRETKTH